MTTDEKLAAILAAIQTDPGNRGLAELFTACPGDFATVCRSISEVEYPGLWIVTGFYIPTAEPPAFETDGPLGALFLMRALTRVRGTSSCRAELPVQGAVGWGMRFADYEYAECVSPSHVIFLERGGPSAGGRRHTMRGQDITAHVDPNHEQIPSGVITIGIGDGGNEIGMGKIPHEIVARNIPNGDLIHCRVPTDHLIVAGVSNWGAYALAAGIYVLRGIKPPADLFDPDREREILEVMVKHGPLVDGVTGKQTATVDGLTWDEYVKPLIRIREILES